MSNKFKKLFEKWQCLENRDKQAIVLACLFGHMKCLYQEGGKENKAAAEAFLEAVESILEQIS